MKGRVHTGVTKNIFANKKLSKNFAMQKKHKIQLLP